MNTQLFSLSGHTAIVTGGASGIGLATVNTLAACGANIVIADLNESAGFDKVRQLQEHGTNALFVKTDVSDANDVTELIAKTTHRFESLEILMHFAGIGMEKLTLDTNLDEWNKMITVNLTGTFLVMQAAARVMVTNKYGRIVSMASIAGIRGGTGRAAYGASKGGVIALTQVMALELATAGITVNTLAPGAIETELVRKMHDGETRRAYLQSIPMNRYGKPEEVAAAAVYLALPESRYITGVTFPIDGGFASSGVIKNGFSQR